MNSYKLFIYDRYNTKTEIFKKFLKDNKRILLTFNDFKNPYDNKSHLFENDKYCEGLNGSIHCWHCDLILRLFRDPDYDKQMEIKDNKFQNHMILVTNKFCKKYEKITIQQLKISKIMRDNGYPFYVPLYCTFICENKIKHLYEYAYSFDKMGVDFWTGKRVENLMIMIIILFVTMYDNGVYLYCRDPSIDMILIRKGDYVFEYNGEIYETDFCIALNKLQKFSPYGFKREMNLGMINRFIELCGSTLKIDVSTKKYDNDIIKWRH